MTQELKNRIRNYGTSEREIYMVLFNETINHLSDRVFLLDDRHIEFLKILEQMRDEYRAENWEE